MRCVVLGQVERGKSSWVLTRRHGHKSGLYIPLKSINCIISTGLLGSHQFIVYDSRNLLFKQSRSRMNFNDLRNNVSYCQRTAERGSQLQYAQLPVYNHHLAAKMLRSQRVHVLYS